MRRPAGFPDTTTSAPRSAGRAGSGSRRSGPAPVGVVVVVLLFLLLVALSGAYLVSGGGEEYLAPGVSGFVLGSEASDYPPPSDTRGFESPAAVHAYLTLDGVEAGGEFEARVERRSVPLSSEFRSGELTVGSSGEDRLVSGPDGLSGLLRFEVRAEGGELPPGRYTLLVRTEGGEQVVRQRFTVG